MMTMQRMARTVVFLAGAWAALTVLLVGIPWMPPETWMQSARIVLLPVAAMVLAMCAFGAGAALLGLSGMAVKREALPRPYQPATPPA